MVVLSDMQPRTHTTDLEMFSFEGRCPGCVPAHPWGTPLRLEWKVRGHRLDSQLTPLQEGTGFIICIRREELQGAACT